MRWSKVGLTLFVSLLVTSLMPFPSIFREPLKGSQVLAQALDARTTEADRLLQQGIEQSKAGQLETALQSLQQALDIYREIGKQNGEERIRRREGVTLGSMGLVLGKLGEYNQAINYCQEWLDIAKINSQKKDEAAALLCLGVNYIELEKPIQAIEKLKQSLALTQEIGYIEGERQARAILIISYLKLDDYAKATNYSLQNTEELALEFNNFIRDTYSFVIESLELGSSMVQETNSLVKYLWGQGSVEERLVAEQTSKALQDIEDRIRQLIQNRVGLYEVNQELKRIVDSLQNALDMTQPLMSEISDSQRLSNEFQESIEILKEKSHQIKDNNIYIQNNFINQIKKFITLYESNLTLARDTNDSLAIGSALSSFGNVLFLSGNLVEAETKLLEAVDFFESIRAGLSNDTYKVSIFETQTNTYSRLQEVLIAQNKTTQALEIAERGRARALVELLTSRLSQNNTNLSFTHPPSLQKIQQIAKEQKATIVEYSIIQQIIDAQLFIWVIHPTGEVEFRQVKLRGEQSRSLEELVAETLEFMGVRIRGNQPDSVETISPSIEPNYRLQKLHQLLIEPIADLLPTHPNDRVIFIPHRELFAVPFPALQDSNGKYLIEKHTILTAPSIQVLELTRQQRQRIPSQAKSSLVVGNPTMPKVQPSDGGEPYQLASLDGSEREAQAIASLLNTKPLIGDQATKATILQQLPQARIVHLATHGLLDDIKGLESAIALAPSGGDNGLLTAEEIFDLKLNAELVVLSACNTGQGRITGDGVIGLSRSLISAGVPSVIVSLWFVPDTPTASLMTNFYRHLQQNPDKAQALRQAMLTTMKQHPNPKDWAAFTLIGEAEGSIPLGKKHYLK